MNWYTADWHFFHKMIIKYCDRPFKSEKHMRNTCISNFNEVVRKEDTTYILGDVAMLGGSQWEKLKGVINSLNGAKHLIYGNHDEFRWQRYVDVGFASVHSAFWLEEEGFRIVMVHDSSSYCIINSNDPEAILLHGHIHNVYKSIPEKRIVNVGVDMWDFKPVNFKQIREELKL